MKTAPICCAVHDLSGVGRCALTVVIPVLSVMGVQVCPAPTAILSTHTGGFTGIASRDLTELLPAYLGHWETLPLPVDAIYTGYLGASAQAETVLSYVGAHPGALFVCDPVMGDEGAMYQAVPKDMPREMKRLAARADVITPNMTEVALLTDTPYQKDAMRETEIERMMDALLALGALSAVVTSAPAPGGLINVCKSRGDKKSTRVPFRRLGVHYPGTGDLFTSVLTGALMTGAALPAAVRRATEYVYAAVEYTMACGTPPRMGVQLEKTLPLLCRT